MLVRLWRRRLVQAKAQRRLWVWPTFRKHREQKKSREKNRAIWLVRHWCPDGGIELQLPSAFRFVRVYHQDAALFTNCWYDESWCWPMKQNAGWWNEMKCWPSVILWTRHKSPMRPSIPSFLDKLSIPTESELARKCHAAFQPSSWWQAL